MSPSTFFRWKHLFGVKNSENDTTRPIVRAQDAWVRVADSYLAKPQVVGFGLRLFRQLVSNAVGLGKKDRLHVQVQGRYVSILRGRDGALQLGGQEDSAFFCWQMRKAGDGKRRWLKDQGWTCRVMQVRIAFEQRLPYKTN